MLPDYDGLTSLASFSKNLGRSPVTVWRWRRLGWIDGIVNIAGKPYIPRAAIRRFEERAARGEFAQSPSGVAAGKSKDLAA